MDVNLKGNPFFLNDEQCAWVNATRDSLSLREKAGQMICCVSANDTKEDLAQKYGEVPFGGITVRPDKASSIKHLVEYIQNVVRVPLLVSANLENGGTGAATDGTEFGSQLQIAATGNPKYAYMLGDICGAEGSCIGINYALAPVVDIPYNWRNPIINTRTYGADAGRVAAFASAYMRGIAKYNVAVSIKHFPGDGVDERDQHLLTSVNPLSCEEWDASYGMVYKTLIEQGAQTVMAAHILLPAYSRHLNPVLRDDAIRPASLSPELIQGLLRGKLGFNGVVITDSAVMTGMSCVLPRREIPAACINAGCDIFLFGRNLQEDFENLVKDIESGIISSERLDEAVTRILALKASLKLHKAKEFTSNNYKNIIGCTAHAHMAEECADQSVTLVKDTQHLLPVTPRDHKRICLHILGDVPTYRGGRTCKEAVIARLERAGFEVTCPEGEALNKMLVSTPVEELKERFDFILYAANIVTGGNDAVNRIRYIPNACGQSPQFVKDIPTMFVSFGSPYHFADVPMIRTFINCYNYSDAVLDAFIEKITGKSEFSGISPVDPFCGMWGALF